MWSATMSRARCGSRARDRLEQIDVLVYACGKMWQALEHEVPDPQREVEVAAQRLLEVGVGGAAVDEAVNARVERHQLRRVLGARAARAQLREELVELAPAPP